MRTKKMTAYDLLMAEGKEKGKAEFLQSTVLNAFDTGIDVSTIRKITGASQEKITHILTQNNRIR